MRRLIPILMLVVAFGSFVIGLTLTSDAIDRPVPSRQLTEDDCLNSGLFPVYIEALPGRNWTKNGMICVAHVEPIGANR